MKDEKLELLFIPSLISLIINEQEKNNANYILFYSNVKKAPLEVIAISVSSFSNSLSFELDFQRKEVRPTV